LQKTKARDSTPKEFEQEEPTSRQQGWGADVREKNIGDQRALSPKQKTRALNSRQEGEKGVLNWG